MLLLGISKYNFVLILTWWINNAWYAACHRLLQLSARLLSTAFWLARDGTVHPTNDIHTRASFCLLGPRPPRFKDDRCRAHLVAPALPSIHQTIRVSRWQLKTEQRNSKQLSELYATVNRRRLPTPMGLERRCGMQHPRPLQGSRQQPIFLDRRAWSEERFNTQLKNSKSWLNVIHPVYNLDLHSYTTQTWLNPRVFLETYLFNSG